MNSAGVISQPDIVTVSPTKLVLASVLRQIAKSYSARVKAERAGYSRLGLPRVGTWMLASVTEENPERFTP